MKPNVRLSEDRKKYIINQREYPRVTDIINIIRRPELEKWKATVGIEEAIRIGNETAEYGDRVHEIVMWNDRGRMDRVEEMIKQHPELLAPWIAWFDWADVNVVKFLYIEEIIWSDRWRCAGKVDRVAIIRGDKKPSILDIKTGSLYDDIGIQLNGYKLIYNEKHNPRVKRTIAVQLPRVDPGVLKIKEYDKSKYTEIFKSAVNLYYNMK